MSNVLIINNSVSNPSWVSSPIYIQNRYQPVQINNCTIANNSSPGFLCRILAGADLRNVIFHNPGSGSELGMINYLSVNATAYPVSISNSLFRTATVPSSRPELLTMTDNLMSADPLFLRGGTSLNKPAEFISQCLSLHRTGTPILRLNLHHDLAGNKRIWYGRIDMGCYEYGSEPYQDTPGDELPRPPDEIMLSIYPNPILISGSKRSNAFIELTLPKKPSLPPTIEIYNLRGQKVKSITLSESYNSLVTRAGLGTELKQAGEFYSTLWNGKGDDDKTLASGTYLIRVSSDGKTAVKKVTIIK